MHFNKHLDLDDKHAFLGGSNHYWMNYTPEKLIESWENHKAKAKGTELHKLAEGLIRNKIKMPKNKEYFNAYVNDAIAYNMTPEVHLVYSDICFGTADAISFNKNVLRIHDLKTGKTPPSMKQLLFYAGVFFLEYRAQEKLDVYKTKVELRIYQKDMPVVFYRPEPDEVMAVIHKIIESNNVLVDHIKGGVQNV